MNFAQTRSDTARLVAMHVPTFVAARQERKRPRRHVCRGGCAVFNAMGIEYRWNAHGESENYAWTARHDVPRARRRKSCVSSWLRRHNVVGVARSARRRCNVEGVVVAGWSLLVVFPNGYGKTGKRLDLQ